MKRTVLSLAAAALVLSLGAAAYADDTPAAGRSSAPPNPAPASDARPMHHAHHQTGAKAASTAIDLNSASKEQLMTLPGITDEVAEKIIAARPFTMRSELVKKSVVSKAEYTKIRGKVTVKKA